MTKPRLLLVDGDPYAYSFASAAEQGFDWGDGLFTLAADAGLAWQNMDAEIRNLGDNLVADKVIVCLSDDDHSWRKAMVYPQYKSSRTTVRRPMILAELKARMKQHLDVKTKPLLEADDVMGIIATSPTLYAGYEKVIVSVDKDMKTIPGQLFRDNKLSTITEEEADYHHLMQTLTGDIVDGYPGCKGIGAVRADAIAKGGWPAVLAAFIKAGHDEAFALGQARCARILRWTDYDYATNQPILWSPPDAL